MGLSALLQKLLFIKKFSAEKGKIEILDSRYVLLNAESLLVLQEIDKTKMYKVIKDASKSNMKKLVQHASVYKNIKDQSLKNIAELSQKIGKSEEGIVKTLQSLFEIYGLGDLEIVELDNENHKASLRIRDSSLAYYQLKKGKSKEPVCSLTAGILAGIFSYLFKKEVDCVEINCHAQGNDLCEFKVS